MKIMERHIGKVRPDKWGELERIEEQYDAIEQQWNFPLKRRYRALYGSYPRDVYIIEREWESMIVRETALGNAFASSEWHALAQDLNTVLENLQIEIYQLIGR